MLHSTNVNFPKSYEDFASRNLRPTPFPVDLVVPPEVLLSLLWASRAPVPAAGPVSAFNFRVGLVDGAPASHVIIPSMLNCAAHRLGHNLCVFAYVEGCESFVVGDLRFLTYGAFGAAFRRVVSILALSFLRPSPLVPGRILRAFVLSGLA